MATTHEQISRDAYDRLERRYDEAYKQMGTMLDKATVRLLLVLTFFLGIAATLVVLSVAYPQSAETKYADAVTEQYPQLERVDAYLYGWMVCDATADGWTDQRTADWLAGEPADFYGVTDPAFGRFVVEAALPMCP